MINLLDESIGAVRGLASSGVELLEPGEIEVKLLGETVLPRTSTGERVKILFNSCGLETRLSDRMDADIWRKLSMNCVINPLTSLFGVSNNEITAEPLKEVRRRIVEECIRVASEERVVLDHSLADEVVKAVSRYSNLSSMCQDMINGRKTEIDFLNGRVSALGRKHGIDIQTSVRTGVRVAEDVTGVSLSKTDVILTIKAGQDVEIVDGQSAGAAITVALIAAIRRQSLNQSVYMTGTINSDRSIGPVGGIPEKALAAAENGSKRFLVPKGQSTVVVYVPKTSRPYPGWRITTYERKIVNLQDYLEDQGFSIIVDEVERTEEAYTKFSMQMKGET